MALDAPQKNRWRPVQFSVLATLIAMSILGPLLGWYGPAAFSRLSEIFTQKPTTTQSPLALANATLAAQMQRNQQLQAKLQQLLEASQAEENATEEIERVMNNFRRKMKSSVEPK